MNIRLLEASLLLVLLLNFLRVNLVVNPIVLLILALLYISFLILSVDFLAIKSAVKYRIFLFWLIVAIAFSFVIFRTDSRLGVHDGAALTKTATSAFMTGQNPYEVSFKNAFEAIDAKPLGVVYNHYMYSPLMFISNIPANFIFSGWYKGNEFLITISIFFIFSSVVASLMVREKMLFLILFLLNPVFVPLTFYGANEAIILFFIIACIVALSYKKITLATILLALALGTKLLAAPFVPLYFIHLWTKTGKLKIKDRNRQLTKQIGIFTVVSLVIYYPFFIWGPDELIGDVIFYHLRGGTESHVIAGFLGVPGVLNNIGLISSNSTFPFYVFQLIIALVALPFFKGILKRSFSVSMLCVAYFFYFSLLLLFSRIIQTSYIAFLSQILLFAVFVGNNQMSTDNKKR